MLYQQTQEEVDAKAQAFVRDYLGGEGKDRVTARRILLKHVEKRHDPMSKAVRKILKGNLL